LTSSAISALSSWNRCVAPLRAISRMADECLAMAAMIVKATGGGQRREIRIVNGVEAPGVIPRVIVRQETPCGPARCAHGRPSRGVPSKPSQSGHGRTSLDRRPCKRTHLSQETGLVRLASMILKNSRRNCLKPSSLLSLIVNASLRQQRSIHVVSRSRPIRYAGVGGGIGSVGGGSGVGSGGGTGGGRGSGSGFGGCWIVIRWQMPCIKPAMSRSFRGEP